MQKQTKGKIRRNLVPCITSDESQHNLCFELVSCCKTGLSNYLGLTIHVDVSCLWHSTT